MCRDLSEIAAYAIVDDARFRLLKRATPGSYTFILRAHARGAAAPAASERARPSACASRASGGARAARRARRADAVGDADCSPAKPRRSPTRRRSASGSSTSSTSSSTAAPAASSRRTVIDLTGDEPVVLRVGKGLARALRGRARLIKLRRKRWTSTSSSRRSPSTRSRCCSRSRCTRRRTAMSRATSAT